MIDWWLERGIARCRPRPPRSFHRVEPPDRKVCSLLLGRERLVGETESRLTFRERFARTMVSGDTLHVYFATCLSKNLQSRRSDKNENSGSLPFAISLE